MQAGIAVDGVIVNVIALPDDWTADAEGAWKPESGQTVVLDAAVQIGWTLVDGVWKAPPFTWVPEPGQTP